MKKKLEKVNNDIINDLMSMFNSSKYGEVYSRLAGNRMIFLSENITKETSSAISALLLYYDNESNDDITIFINTNGGDSDALSNIYDVMQIIKSPIKTICVGKAYSAGAFLLAAGEKGKRYITKNSKVMIHGVQFAFPIDDKLESERYLDFVEFKNKYVLSILSTHTGQPLEKVAKDCSRDLFLDAKEALKYGIVDKII